MTMTTAHAVFAHIATLIRQGFVPADTTGEARAQAEARAKATAATFEQVGQIAADLPLTLADAGVGYACLSRAAAAEPNNITARRKTCSQISKLIFDDGDRTSGGSPERLAPVFDAVAERFDGSEDPRQQAIATTARREAAELRPEPH